MLPDTSFDDVTRPWDQMENEPDVWFRIFTQYYLPMGVNRSVRNAFEYYIRTEKPLDYKDVDPNEFRYIPSHWAEYSRKFEWARRATAYDEAGIPGVADLQVNAVISYLQSNAMRAAMALVDSLKNPRTAVQASNSILNRGGVPETTSVHLEGGVNISSDEMAAAAEKVSQWMAQRQNPSG